MTREGDKDEGELVFIGGLWKNTSKSGVEYFKGSFGAFAEILIFEKRDREGRQPTHNMFIKNRPRKDDDGGNRGGGGGANEERSGFGGGGGRGGSASNNYTPF